MNGADVLGTLKQLARDVTIGSHGARLRKALAVAAIPASAGFAVACYGMPMDGDYMMEAEVCSDGYDNDGDGLADCLDDDCSALELCNGCDDGYDNDGDGSADCNDATCIDSEACAGDCDNGIDDDGDGLADCTDPDCAGSPDCA